MTAEWLPNLNTVSILNTVKWTSGSDRSLLDDNSQANEAEQLSGHRSPEWLKMNVKFKNKQNRRSSRRARSYRSPSKQFGAIQSYSQIFRAIQRNIQSNTKIFRAISAALCHSDNRICGVHIQAATQGTMRDLRGYILWFRTLTPHSDSSLWLYTDFPSKGELQTLQDALMW